MRGSRQRRAMAEARAETDARREAIFRVVTDDAARREHSRFAVEFDISMSSEHNFYRGLAENMSEGGVFIATHLRKAVGELLELTIHLPDGAGPIHVHGEVRWVREYMEDGHSPPGLGVQFSSLADSEQARIHNFLASREPLFYD